ncbi:hypothetical protein [Lentzea sp. NPDC060358]|uniref:hypothetical protein n=1 Tax=Lentzea sp. NPDC060358 TaxID=3347103 RepID=UPI00366A1462
MCHTLGSTQDPPPFVQEQFDRAGMSIAAKIAVVGRMHDRGVRSISGTDGGIEAGKPHGITAHALGQMVTTTLPRDRREWT